MSATTDTRRRAGKRGDGEGSIRKRADGMWRGEVMVGYRPDGKPDRRYVYAMTRKECQEKLNELRRRASGGILGDAEKERETLASYLERWVHATKTNVKLRTWERYAEIVRLHLKPGVGRHKLSALKPDHVQQLYGQKLESGLSAQTVVHIHRVLHRALNQAVRWGYAPRNVCQLVDAPKVAKREMRPPTPEEVGKLLDAAESDGDRLAALWALAAFTGARQGELLGLQWSDVSLEAGTMQVQRSLVRVVGGKPTYGEPKTAKSRRLVALTPDAVAALKAHQDRQMFEQQKIGDGYADNDLVFCTTLGTPLDKTNVTHYFKQAIKRAALREDIRFHDLRHGAISVMLQEGLPVAAVSESVGHHSPAMTYGVYAHVLPGSKRQAAEVLGEVLRRARRASV